MGSSHTTSPRDVSVGDTLTANEVAAIKAATTLDGTHPPVVLGDAILSGGTNSIPLALRGGPLKPLVDSTTAIQVQQADGTPFVYWDTTNKRQGINTAAPATQLHIAESSTTSPRGPMSSQHSDGTEGARFHGRKSRGTVAAPTVIVTGDTLIKWVGSAYDGTKYFEAAAVSFESEGTIATDRVPARIVFSTNSDAAPSVLTERMSIDSAGIVVIKASSPTYKMQATGTSGVCQIGLYENSTTLSAYFQYRGSTATNPKVFVLGTYISGGTVQINSGSGTAAITIDSSQNVSLASTSALKLGTQQVLAMSGAIVVVGDTADVKMGGKFGCNGVTPPTKSAFIAQLSTGGAETNANICTAINALLTMGINHGFMAAS